MALLENLLRRLGYIKLSTYGFVMTPDNRVMPMLAQPSLPPEWQSEPGDTLPSAPPMAIVAPPPPAMSPPQPLAPTPTQPPPVPQGPPPPTLEIAASAPASAPPRGADAEEEWEWRMAMARARARGDQTELAPCANKPTRVARGTSPPPHSASQAAVQPVATAPIATAPVVSAPVASAPVSSRPVATKPPLRRVGPPPGIGRRMRSAVHRKPIVRTVATAERTRRDLNRVEKPIPLPPRPDRPDLKLVDPDTVVTVKKPGAASFSTNAPLPSLTKRMAAG